MLYGPSSNKNYQNRFPESTFHHFWGQAMKMLKICFQNLLLTISGASHGKCLKSTSGGYFWPYLVPSSENAQNQLPEATFNNIRGQATKMLKIDYWSVHWTISWNLLPSTWTMFPEQCSARSERSERGTLYIVRNVPKPRNNVWAQRRGRAQ